MFDVAVSRPGSLEALTADETLARRDTVAGGDRGGDLPMAAYVDLDLRKLDNTSESVDPALL
jgi:hypothetical protein